jgi:xanthine dehydrogenase accessory factor
MKELSDIVKAYDAAVLCNKKMALATVVKVVGSSYRRPGARMLVTEEGIITGAISGGCLEGDALRKSQLAIFEGKNRLEIYDTTDDEDNRLGVQLGCNGIVYILFEPIDVTQDNNPVKILRNIANKRREAVLVTLFDESKHGKQIGTCACFTNNDIQLAHQNMDLKAGAGIALQHQTNFIERGAQGAALYQYVAPNIQLVIAGAGNDVQPLVAMASLLGWDTIVADGRPAYATANRFPLAKKLLVTKPVGILSEIRIDARTAVVLMTHNYNYDLEVLKQLQATPCCYIGMLGPRSKLHNIQDELLQQGCVINEKCVFGPVGLDIGAETAEEIALAVLAEIKAVFAGRKGGSLNKRDTEIHARNIAMQYD